MSIRRPYEFARNAGEYHGLPNCVCAQCLSSPFSVSPSQRFMFLRPALGFSKCVMGMEVISFLWAVLPTGLLYK